MDGSFVDSVSLQEIFIEVATVSELLADQVLEGLKVLLFDVDHLELSLQQIVFHVVQHFGLELAEGLDYLIFEIADP